MNSAFLASSFIIDWQTPCIRQLAEEMRQQADGELNVAHRTFEWVRNAGNRPFISHNAIIRCS